MSESLLSLYYVNLHTNKHTTFTHIVFIVVFSALCASIINFHLISKKHAHALSNSFHMRESGRMGGQVWDCLHPFSLTSFGLRSGDVDDEGLQV